MAHKFKVLGKATRRKDGVARVTGEERYSRDIRLPISESPYLEDLSVFFANTYEPNGPFGAKGIGEAATNPVAAAYANAVYNAIGVRFYELPMTPEKILLALRNLVPACEPA